MPYGLGIDLGTSYTVAAIGRIGVENADPEVVTLGFDRGRHGVPTVLHLADDGAVLIGAAAERLIVSDPDRVCRGFVHRVGDPSQTAPRLRPEVLTARLVRWVVDAVTQREGEAPEQVTLAHPAVWDADACGLVQQALTMEGLPDVGLVPTPIAATVAHHAQVGAADTEDTLAVYDLGATFSASITHRVGDDVTILGRPQAMANGGGALFDELVLGRVLNELGDQVAAADLDNHAVLAGMAELLMNCVAAREALTERTEVDIPVTLPGLNTEFRLTTEELETLLDPALRETVETLRTAMWTAEVTPTDVRTVLVIGGCAESPQVARLLCAELGRPVTVPRRPELTVACGAALMAARSGSGRADSDRPGSTASVAAAAPADTTLALPGLTLPTGGLPTGAFPTAPLSGGPLASVDAANDATASEGTEIPEDRFAARSRSGRPPRALLVTAAGLIAVTMVVLPITLLRATGSGATQTSSNERDVPGNLGDPAPAYGGAGAPLSPTDDVASPSITIPVPTSSAIPTTGIPLVTTPPPRPLPTTDMISPSPPPSSTPSSFSPPPSSPPSTSAPPSDSSTPPTPDNSTPPSSSSFTIPTSPTSFTVPSPPDPPSR